ncbi:MAG: glycosyltransferase family 4 protein [Acidimicrobiia bacterium]|nr:glycosyltransferase family 4 protein [Acidimicrobiia bacterium]
MNDPGDRLRVLVVGMRPPRLPIRDGYVLHLYHLLKQLHRHHDVRFLAPDDENGLFKDIDGLNCSLVAGGRRKLERETLDQIGRFKPQVVHVVGAPLAGILRRLPRPMSSILGALDAPHLNVDAVEARTAAGLISKRVKRARAIWAIRHSYRQADRVVVVSAEDREALEHQNARLSVSVIPNGVDVDDFGSRRDVARQRDHLLFTGALDYPPNVSAALFLVNEVLPRIRAVQPSARVSLVGRDPSDEIRSLDGRPGVDVVGPVDVMVDALAVGSVYVCPMISGTGIKNKLLEALANGLPCVASELAVRGTSLADGIEVLIANTADEVAEATLRLLSDAGLRERIGSAGQDYVTRNHAWSSIGELYSDLYRAVLTPGGGEPR